MGIVAQRSTVQLSTRVKPSTAREIAVAAAKIDQPIAVWLRLAIVEKLDRDRAHDA